MQIRQATENDVESLVDLWIELMDYHVAFSTQFLINKNKRAAIEAFILEKLGKKLSRIYVMEADNAIVAMLLARIDVRPEMFLHPKSGYIAETIVTKVHRGKNIGNELAPVFLTGSPEFTDQIILSAGAAHLYRCKVLSAWYLTDWFVW